ncbi:hypothetical protein HYV69_02660 [Candidatus Uhrbacteria bacterium]|nr:hypothetical protein [Candidatus Uhrbacteria bacterium]
MTETEPRNFMDTKIESKEEVVRIEDSPPTSSEEESAAQRAENEEAFAEAEARSQGKAAELSAELKSKKEPEEIKVVEKPPSQRGTFLRGYTKLGATWPFGQGVRKLGKATGMWWDDFFSAIEKSGQEEIKKHWKAANPVSLELSILSPIVGLGVFLAGKVGLSKPEKSLREQEVEAGKKKKAEAAKKKKEDEKYQRLRDEGVSEKTAKAILKVEKGEEKDEEKKEETKPSESAEEKKAD